MEFNFTIPTKVEKIESFMSNMELKDLIERTYEIYKKQVIASTCFSLESRSSLLNGNLPLNLFLSWLKIGNVLEIEEEESDNKENKI